jgi:hypothetical protein
VARPAARAEPPPTVDDSLYSLREIEHHYWQDADSLLGYKVSTTLHDSAKTPGSLSYVLLFKGANPRWEQEGIIFTKSNLRFLPAEFAEANANANPDNGVEDEHEYVVVRPAPTADGDTGDTITSGAAAETTANTTTELTASEKSKEKEAASIASAAPVAVFDQKSSTRSEHKRSFAFEGYYRISRIEFVEPRSPELVRLLEQKWGPASNARGWGGGKQRSKEDWAKSLRLRWAVIKMEKDEQATEERGKPDILKLADEPDGVQGQPKSGKSVNEMLKELRMADDHSKDDEANKENVKAEAPK